MADLASRIGMKQSNLIVSLRNNPKLSTLETICDALGIKMVELFGGKTEKGDGIIVLNGEFFSISKPTPRTVRIPAYTDYSLLRKDLTRFISKSVKEKVTSSICGLLEDFEFFTLMYDYVVLKDSNAVVYEKFSLILCYENQQTIVRQYDISEYNRNGKHEWDTTFVESAIIFDIEEFVLKLLGQEPIQNNVE